METSLSQYLKDSTRSNHGDAESHPFQSALANGLLPAATYCQYLVQLRIIHESVETRLAANFNNRAIQSVVIPQYYQLPFLNQDLEFLQVPVSAIQPLECVRKFCSSSSFDTAPASLLGVLYVLLGSKHGAKFIAHKVKDAYSLTDRGYTYFNPYGENFRELWLDFIDRLNALNLTAVEREGILASAKDTFDVFSKIGIDLWRTATPVNA